MGSSFRQGYGSVRPSSDAREGRIGCQTAHDDERGAARRPPSAAGEVVASRLGPIQDHIVVIPGGSQPIDWLDSCCWACGTRRVATTLDGVVLCRPCRKELLAEPAVDALGVARLAYWESHALRCCWRCLAGAVDPDDEVGMCRSCREDLGAQVAEGAA
jgi:hypothetical protein